jgi:copper chaperone CopZ
MKTFDATSNKLVFTSTGTFTVKLLGANLSSPLEIAPVALEDNAACTMTAKNGKRRLPGCSAGRAKPVVCPMFSPHPFSGSYAMRRAAIVFGLLLVAAPAVAETKVTVSETHLCCGQCLRGVDAALKDVAGVKHTSSQQAKTIEIVAESDEAAQKAIDALATAGFYGKLNSDKVKFKPVTAADATAQKLELAGIHNCCGQCTNAIKKAVTGVSGVTGTNIKNRDTAFAVEGNFKPGEVVKALLDAGFYVQVK